MSKLLQNAVSDSLTLAPMVLKPFLCLMQDQPKVIAELLQLFPDLPLETPGERVRLETLNTLLQKLYDSTGMRELGLKAGSGFPIEGLSAFTHMIMCCETLEDALREFCQHYDYLAGYVPMPQVLRRGECFSLMIEARNHETMADVLRLDYLLAAIVRMVGNLTSQRCRLRTLGLPRRAFQDHELYREFFDCDVQLQSGTRLELQYPLDCLEYPLPTANAQLKALLRQQFQQERDCVPHDLSTRARVHAVVAGCRQREFPSRSEVARAMNLSDSTLKRRLAEEGLAYNEIIQGIRRDRATRLLLQDDLAVADIAQQLGFAESSSFDRAFRKWLDMAPGEYRRLAEHAGLPRLQVDHSDPFQLPSSPGVCRAVLEMIDQPDRELDRLNSTILRDPVLTARLAGMANRRGLGRESGEGLVQSIVPVLGVNFLKFYAQAGLARSAAVIHECPDFNLAGYWVASQASSELVRRLASLKPTRFTLTPDTLYLCTLLSGIGTFLLAHSRPSETMALIQQLRNRRTTFEQRRQLEQEYLGISCFAAAQLLLASWGLPGAVCRTVGNLQNIGSRHQVPGADVTLIHLVTQQIRQILLYADTVAEDPNWIAPLASLIEQAPDRVMAEVIDYLPTLNRLYSEARQFVNP